MKSKKEKIYEKNILLARKYQKELDENHNDRYSLIYNNCLASENKNILQDFLNTLSDYDLFYLKKYIEDNSYDEDTIGYINHILEIKTKQLKKNI